ncbi:MAG TPA: ATP-binding protein [Steroidobacteraceae bacterium]
MCALLSARAIRAGVPLIVSVLLLATPAIVEYAMAADTARDAPLSSSAALALLGACLNLALVVTFVILHPRRNVWLPPTRRWRLEDMLFMASVAAMAPAAQLLRADGPAADASMGWWVSSSILAVQLGIAIVSVFGSRKVRKLRLALMSGRLHAARAPAGRLPGELALLFLSGRHVSDGLHRRSAIQGLHLESARLRAGRLQQQIDTHDRDRRRIDLELKQVRKFADESDRRWRALLNTVPDALFITDLKGRIEFVNEGVRALLGYVPEKLAGSQIAALVPASQPGRELPDLDAFFTAGEADATPVERNVRFVDARGVVRELAVRVQSLQIPEGAHLSIRLREATGALQRGRDQFVATMSHEIRTPLHGLMATIDMLRSEALSAEGRRRLGIARTSAKTLVRIANDVLDLTRISAGGMPIERKPMSIERLVNDVVDEARERDEALPLFITAEVGNEVPAAVLGDPLRIKQVLRNLVSNALKFTANGGVTVSAYWLGGQCTIDVADTGSGIAPNRRESIFEAFVQADRSTSRRHGGAGLGLSIGRQLSEAMRGSLTLLQSGSRGSTFRLVLPLPATDEPVQDEQSQRNLPVVKGRILVAEDDEASRYVAQTLLESLECPARIVANGIEALEELRSGEFDLALLDCEMPELDGYEVTARIRKLRGRHIPIIAMTASTMSADRQRCFDAGMDDLLAKPFGKSALNDMLAKWLSPQPVNSAQAPIAQEVARRPELDTSVFEELRQSLNWKIPPLQKIYRSVRESARAAIEALGGGKPKDLELAHRRLHSLQGGAGLVGARQMEYVAGRLLQVMKDDTHQGLAEGLAVLVEALRRFEIDLDKRLDALNAR